MVHRKGETMAENPLHFRNQASNVVLGDNFRGQSQTPEIQQPNLQNQPYGNINVNELQMYRDKTSIDLHKNEHMIQQKLNYQWQCAEIKEKHDADRQLSYPEIYKNQEDRLIYAIVKPDGSKVSCKELVNARGVKSFLCYSFYPQFQQLLCVSFNYNEIILCLDYDIKINVFLNKLRSRGLPLLVSERAQKEAASALFAYLINTAVKCELPFDSGWWKDGCNNWHFAKVDDLTIKKVREKYAL